MVLGEAVRVGIVGAGASGASTAYFLRQLCPAAHITVYDERLRVGGRSTTIAVLGDPTMPLEIGGSMFVSRNRILMEAVEAFHLDTESDIFVPGSDSMGVWDGERFVYIRKYASAKMELARMLWLYGTAPVRVYNAAKRIAADFLRVYDMLPFESVTDVLHALGTDAYTSTTSDKEFSQYGEAFGNDILQAFTRAYYGQNWTTINGLAGGVSVIGASTPAYQVSRGNWRIFEHMLTNASAKVFLNTSVTHVDNAVMTLASGAVHTHDAVVLTGPARQDIVDFEMPIYPYVGIHILVIVTRAALSPAYFASDDQVVPESVLTTCSGTTPLFSSILFEGTIPDTDNRVYKITSRYQLSNGDLKSLFDARLTETDWTYRHFWPTAYPELSPRTDFGKSVHVANNTFWTGGMDGAVSTMETNAIAGKNAAHLIAKFYCT